MDSQQVDRDTATLGVVAIGRNEGERLKACLRSVPGGLPLVYVDSASSDGSAEFARGLGALLVELDLSRPFTAARARNEGFERLIDEYPQLEFVQFVDGDCEFEPGWLNGSVEFLRAHSDVAAVCGRRRERYPDASFYNRLCDDEWNTPVGNVDACGGDSLLRVAAMRKVGCFDPEIVAGEEPELCHRLRADGWRICRLDLPMTIHDADMHHFRQYWLRSVRGGFGYVQAWSKTRGRGLDPLYAREVKRACFWAAIVPLASVALAVLVRPSGLLLAPVLWLVQFARLSLRSDWRRAGLLMFGKMAEFIGISKYAKGRIARRRQGTIFYK